MENKHVHKITEKIRLNRHFKGTVYKEKDIFVILSCFFDKIGLEISVTKKISPWTVPLSTWRTWTKRWFISIGVHIFGSVSRAWRKTWKNWHKRFIWRMVTFRDIILIPGKDMERDKTTKCTVGWLTGLLWHRLTVAIQLLIEPYLEWRQERPSDMRRKKRQN